MLADFRTWLQQLPADAVGPPPSNEPVDLHTLVGHFTALRHEVNLQTKAVRAQQEQTEESLRLLAETVEALERRGDEARQSQQQADDERLRPLLKGLVEMYDALALAKRELERVRENAVTADGPPPGDAPIPELPPPPEVAATPSFWDTFLGRAAAWRNVLAQQQDLLAQWRQRWIAEREGRRRVRPFVESVITGYTMSLQRLERLLEQHGLEPMNCTGQPFDPERMEVLEGVSGSGRPSGEVLEEVRRGYLWRGRVFRYALVRVAKG